MIRLHDRCFLKEIFGPLLISLVAFLMMMSLQVVYQMVDMLTSHRLQMDTLGLMLLFKLPGMVRVSLPVALLVGSSLAISRLMHDSELTAMRVAGLPIWRFLMPLACIGVIFSLASWVLGEFISPATDHRAEAMQRKLLFEGEVAGLQPDTFFRYGSCIFSFHLSNPISKDVTQLTGVLIYQMQAPSGTSDRALSLPKTIGPQAFWTAETAEARGQNWILYNTIQHDLSPEGITLSDHSIGVLRLNLHRNIQFFLANQQQPEELTAAQLKSRIRVYRHLSLPQSVIVPLMYEYSFRLALPFACLVFALVSAPLTLRYGHGGSLVGILVSFGVVFMYYNVMVIAQKFAMNGGISPGLAAWTPNILFGFLGIYLIMDEK